MNRILVVAALSLTFPLAGMAQSTTQTASLSTPITPREAHSLLLSAHSGAQYQQLAGYFHQQEAKYRAEATRRDRRLRGTLQWLQWPNFPSLFIGFKNFRLTCSR